MFRSRLFSLALLAITQPVFAQSAGSGVELLSARQISVDQADRPHVESFIAVDPRDPQHLLATAMVFVDGAQRVFPYASFDGGKTWAVGQIIGDSSIVGAGSGDPVVSITSNGICYFSTIDNGRSSFVARSTDGGRTWLTTAVLPYADRQWLVVYPGRGPFGGRTYFTGTGQYQSRDGASAIAPFLARSDDYGLTFPFRSVVSYDRGGANPAAPLNAVPLEPLVTSRGLLVLTLQGGGAARQQAIEQAKRDSLNAWGLGLATSDDGGESFGPALYAPTPRFSLTGSPRRRLRAHSATGYVRTAIDASSGRNRDRIYFVVADYDPGIDRYVVRVWHTGDFGKTWGTAVASDAARGDVANPAIAVNRDGIVAVTWNDRRDDPQGRCWRLYASLSLDGGEHFLPAQRLSNAPTCTNEPKNWDASGSGSAFSSDDSGEYLAHISATALIPTRFPMGGDTQGLAADGTGVFHAAWINGETGVMQLWYTSFRAAPALVAGLRTSGATNTSTGRDSPPPGMEEVTHDVRFVVTKTNLDFSKRTYTITIEIENRSRRPLYGPFRAVMRHFLDAESNGLGLRNLAVANADSGGSSIGATWVFEVPGGILAPGAHSKERVLLFTFEGGIPEFPEGELAPGFRVYGRAQ